MKTIQQVIREADRKEIENEYFYEYSPKLHELTDAHDYTVAELKLRASENFQAFLNRVSDMATEPDPQGEYILFATKSLDGEGFDEVAVELVKVQELLEAEDVNEVQCYAYEYTEWKYALRFLVADNRFTQDNLHDVIVSFLHEISLFGFKPEGTEKAIKDLKKSIDELNARPERGVSWEELRKELGLPSQSEEEVYPEEESKRDAVVKARNEFMQCCRAIELQRIKDTLIPRLTFPENINCMGGTVND